MSIFNKRRVPNKSVVWGGKYSAKMNVPVRLLGRLDKLEN